MTVRVRRARDEAEHAAAEALVESVFGGEQGVPADAIERPVPRAVRLAALADGGELVGTCRVVLDGGVARLGSLVVAAPARRRGVATALVAAAEREARGDGARIMRLHAQIDARPLYDAAGYAPVGAPFREQGIDHLTMEKIL